MFFKKKGYLRQEFDEQLIGLLNQCKNDWLREKSIIEKSIEPSDELLYSASLSELKYFYTLREAKKRKVQMRKVR